MRNKNKGDLFGDRNEDTGNRPATSLAGASHLHLSSCLFAYIFPVTRIPQDVPSALIVVSTIQKPSPPLHLSSRFSHPHTDHTLQFHPSYDDDPMSLMQGGRPPRRFDEYYRCYPVSMLAGPDRDNVTHGGKAILPPSALDKLTRLHISYPMLFELINGAADLTTHAGVLEFIAEEGRIYLPPWILDTLALSPGDLLQIKSTDLPLGNFIKVQPQSPSFLDITDPKAVLENAFRNFSCLTLGDIFTFAYNDTIYSIKVLETKPTFAANGAICVIETDIEVDFAPPLGYVEPQRQSGASTPATGAGKGGTLHTQGSMAQAINYASIAPSSSTAAAGAKAVSSNFLSGGHKLKASKSSKTSTPKASTPVAGTSSNTEEKEKELVRARRSQGPQPLRLAPGKLFFGYEVKALKGKGEGANGEGGEGAEKKVRFPGQGNVLRKGGKGAKVEEIKEEGKKGWDGTGEKGRTLKDSKK